MEYLSRPIMVLLRGFATFSGASGLQMSPAKTSAYFNGVPGWVKEDILQVARNYLWDGTVAYMRVPNVSWDKSCSPKAEGGLGIKDSYALNIAVDGKLNWWIYCCPDKLWVKWVNQIYLKGKNLDDYTPTGDLSWGWKNVCRVKEKLSSGYCQGQWLLDPKGYNVSSGYELLRKKYPPVQWHKYIWHSWSVPKHIFIGWLITREALQVKEKLYALGISPDDLCLLCGREVESHHHLFHQCVYSRGILEGMARLCNVNIPTDDILQWIWHQHWSKIKNGILCCAFLACYYQIWMQRHQVRHESCLLRPAVMLEQTRRLVKLRISTHCNQIQGNDKIWLESIGLCK
ncbi:uncharacterized protein LOC141655309 [Silene latifolia]|uniref:uncharacterized protein LOC141655309 n=1 Tax=Silene latifolia TaxID=37657 RepID=UPI003D784CA5